MLEENLFLVGTQLCDILSLLSGAQLPSFHKSFSPGNFSPEKGSILR